MSNRQTYLPENSAQPQPRPLVANTNIQLPDATFNNETPSPSSSSPHQLGLSDSGPGNNISSPSPFKPDSQQDVSSISASGAESSAHHQKALKEREREEKISLALRRVNEGLSYRQAAKEIGISFGTIYGRFRGRKSRIRAQEVRMKLSFLEETIIEKVLLSLIYIGKPATQPFFVHIVNAVLQAQGESRVDGVTRQWYRHFRQRHPSIDACDFSILNNPSTKNDSSHELKTAWFSFFERVCRKYKVLPENIYAMDELGYAFSVGYSSSTQTSWQNPSHPTASATSNADASATRGSLGSASSCEASVSSASSTVDSVNSSNRSVVSVDNGALNVADPPAESFISLDTICGDGTALPPYLVLQSELAEKFPVTYPSSWQTTQSKSGWLNEKILLNWIKRHFDPLTSAKADGKQRILILDTHVGHFSLRFLQYGQDHNITFLFAPTHSDSLHPLETSSSHSMSRDITGTKPDFQSAINRFAVERKISYEKDRVKAAWRKSGLIPFDPTMTSYSSSTSRVSKPMQAPMTPITDEYESSSSYSASPAANFNPNEETVLRYVPVHDLNYDSISSNSPSGHISPNSKSPLFPDTQAAPNPTEELMDEISSFDLKTYPNSPLPTRDVSVSTETDMERLSQKGKSIDLFGDISKSVNTMQNNKTLGENSMIYHQFMEGFVDRLQTSLKNLSSSLKERDVLVTEEINKLAALANELKVVDSYSKDLSSQILNSISANSAMAHSLVQYTRGSEANAADEASHKRGIRSVESRSSDDDIQYQKRKENMAPSMHNTTQSMPDKTRKRSNSFNTTLHFYRQGYDDRHDQPSAQPGPSNESPRRQSSPCAVFNSQPQSPNAYTRPLAELDMVDGDTSSRTQRLPSMTQGAFDTRNILPPLNFNQMYTSQHGQSSGGPTSLAQYSQPKYSDQNQNRFGSQ